MGPPRGYFPEPTMSILVVSPRNMDRSKEFSRGMVMTVVTGSRYLGGFIGDWGADTTWFVKKVQGWDELARKLLGVDRKNPQSDYAGL